MNIVVECDNCGKPQTFHLRDMPCFDEVEHLCSDCFEAEVDHLSVKRAISGGVLRDRAIHGPLKPVSAG